MQKQRFACFRIIFLNRILIGKKKTTTNGRRYNGESLRYNADIVTHPPMTFSVAQFWSRRQRGHPKDKLLTSGHIPISCTAKSQKQTSQELLGFPIISRGRREQGKRKKQKWLQYQQQSPAATLPPACPSPSPSGVSCPPLHGEGTLRSRPWLPRTR